MVEGIGPATVDVVLQDVRIAESDDGTPQGIGPGLVGVDVERTDDVDAPVEVVSARQGESGRLSLDLQARLLGVGIHDVIGDLEPHVKGESGVRNESMGRPGLRP